MQEYFDLLEKYKKVQLKERKANDEMLYFKNQADRQSDNLEKLLAHKHECVDGLQKSNASWLTATMKSEYKLLLQHIESLVADDEFKVESSNAKYQAAFKTWTKVHETLKQLTTTVKEMKEQQEQELVGHTDGSESAMNDLGYVKAIQVFN